MRNSLWCFFSAATVSTALALSAGAEPSSDATPSPFHQGGLATPPSKDLTLCMLNRAWIVWEGNVQLTYSDGPKTVSDVRPFKLLLNQNVCWNFYGYAYSTYVSDIWNKCETGNRKESATYRMDGVASGPSCAMLDGVDLR